MWRIEITNTGCGMIAYDVVWKEDDAAFVISARDEDHAEQLLEFLNENATDGAILVGEGVMKLIYDAKIVRTKRRK